MHLHFKFTVAAKPAEQPGSFSGLGLHRPAFYTEADKYQKVSFPRTWPPRRPSSSRRRPTAGQRWCSITFVAGWAPAAGSAVLRQQVSSDLYYSAGVIIGGGDRPRPRQPGYRCHFQYAGPPRSRTASGQLAKGFDLVVDYGWLTDHHCGLLLVLEWFKLTGSNWGWAIILVTIA